MSVLCPQCGAPVNEGAAKCEYCGAAIAQPQAPVQPQYQPQPQQQAYAAYQQNSVNAERANWPIKNKIVAAILALILGGLGVHKFYLGQTGKGVLYLIFCWTYIPSILAFIEGIMILCSNDENFQIKYKCRIG
jgi:TM2 domain-containing membrane protein YozV